ncbi:DUF401 family protein [Desulfoscipio sp. XC116]|uniref:DUF401 family protein n=1 Tax=Desulfoscipio sp. XC116 TaxID=3144975 RepID=UPI00325B09A6
MWPIAKLLFVFLLMVLMLRKNIGIGITMMISTGILGIIYGLNIVRLIKQFGLTIMDVNTLSLVLILVLIMILESIMRHTNMLETMTNSLSHLPLNHGIQVAIIPAIVGFLPSAGGARFTAPLVAQATANTSYRAEDKAFINYWFRHIWEFSLPLYPGLILAAHIAGIPIGTMFLWLWPISIFWALLGYWLVFKYNNNEVQQKAESPVTSDSAHEIRAFLQVFIKNTWPLWVTVVLALFIPILWALILVLCCLILQKRYPLALIWQTLKEPITIKIVLLTWGVMAFKDVLELSGAVVQVSNAIAILAVPILVLVIILPLITGMLTGMVQACAGIAFPLLVSIVEPTTGYAVLAYVAGTVGVMISPLHLCLILTIDYFKVNFMSCYKSLILPGLMPIAAALGIYWLQKFF